MSRTRKKWEMDRRTFLKGTAKGAGFFLGLPMLEAMLPSIARAAGPYPDANFIAMYKPLGIDRLSFFPNQYINGNVGTFMGNAWNLDGFSSKALSAHKDVISIFAGVGHHGGRGEDHNEECTAFLTGLPSKGGEGNYNTIGVNPGSISTQGKSADQYIAERLFETANPLRASRASLEVAVDLSTVDPQCNVISFKNKDTGLIPANNLATIFDTIFYGYVPGGGTLSEKDQRKRNVMDDIWNEGTRNLVSKLGVSDKATMDSFFQSILDVKKKIDGTVGGGGGSCTMPAKPTNSNFINPNGMVTLADLQRHFDILTDLMVIAIQCNRTRVISMFMAPGIGHAGRNWRNTYFDSRVDAITTNATQRTQIKNILNDVDWHNVSHTSVYDNIPGRLANAVIDEFYLKQLALLIGKLKAANLMNKTLIFFSAGFGNPSYHATNSLPCITAGGSDIGAKTNMLRVFQPYHEFDDNEPGNHYVASHSRILVDIMQAFSVQGVTINNFGLRGATPGHAAESLSDPARAANFGLF